MEKSNPLLDWLAVVDMDWQDNPEMFYLCAKYREQQEKEKEEYFSYLRYSE